MKYNFKYDHTFSKIHGGLSTTTAPLCKFYAKPKYGYVDFKTLQKSLRNLTPPHQLLTPARKSRQSTALSGVEIRWALGSIALKIW